MTVAYMISTHATHKGGDGEPVMEHKILQRISTHATHKGGDILYNSKIINKILFQLTPPIRAATRVRG